MDRALQYSGSCSHLRISACRGRRTDMGGSVGRQLRELLDVEDEGDPSIAEDRGGGDAWNGAIAVLDALDHHLLVATQLIDDETEAYAFSGLGDDDDTIGEVAHPGRDVEQIGEMDEWQEVSRNRNMPRVPRRP